MIDPSVTSSPPGRRGRPASLAGPGPLRTCIACRTRRAPTGLLRFRRRPDGVVVPAVERRTASTSGRTAYVCPQRACLQAAVSRDAFARGLGRRAGGEGQRVHRPDLATLWPTVISALDREIELLNRTGASVGSPSDHPRLEALAHLRRALGEPGRND